MKIYLAAKYARREEVCGYADELTAAGLKVVARWPYLKAHNPNWLISDYTPEMCIEVACEDWEDVKKADTVISFTEPVDSPVIRGSRHVEFGIALGENKYNIVVGPRENFFHYLPQVKVFDTWPEAREHILERAVRTESERPAGS